MANWALVIGVNQYSRLEALNCAVSDAKAMVNYFWEEANFEQIFYFSDESPNFTAPNDFRIETKPTYTNLLSFLDDFFADDEEPWLNPGDNFWFFFSGHGIRHEDRDYLMPIDGNTRAIERTAISVNYVTDRLRRCGADNIILFLDACRSEDAKSGLDIGMEKHQGVITIYSCSPKEKSYEIEELGQGAFTYALLEALRIQGENNCATVERLYQQLRYRVPIINETYNKPRQAPYVITEPASKLHLILLPKQATEGDIALLKNDALLAEVQRNFEFAKQLWIRVNIAAGGSDPDAIEAFGRLSQPQHQESLSDSDVTDGTGAKSKQDTATSHSQTDADKVPFVLPQLDVSTFTGREEELQQLEELLLKSQGSKVCSIVGVSGSGGIGKSALACHFATVHRDKFADGTIGLRVDGKDVNTIARLFAESSGEKIDPEDERDAATLMQEVFAHRQMLLIFDNAEDADVKKLRPGGNRCAVIVTTRRRDLAFSLDIGKEETIDLPPLPETDALKLFKKILGAERVENALAATKQLVKLVGNLPLALQVLGAALRGQREPLDDYAQDLEAEKDELLFEELKIEGDRDLSVEASLNLSLKYLSEDEVEFFACLSACAAEGFSRKTAMAATGCSSNMQAKRRLNKLYNLSLLNYVDTGENRFVLQPLVQAYMKALARKRGRLAKAQERHAKFFVEWLQSDNLEDADVVAEVAANLDDAILAAEWLQDNESETTKNTEKSYKFALRLQPLFEQYGYWQKAITLMTRFQSWAEEFQDWNSVARYKMHEARYWSFAEEFERAEEILSSALIDLERIEDLDTRKRREVKLLSVLGGVFQKQGKTEEAIQNFRVQILIEEEIGDEKSLAIVCNRLGKLLQSQGKLEEARLYFERNIEIAQTLNDQSFLAIGLNCLGGVLQKQGKLEEAQQAFERGIEIAEALNDQSSLAIGLNCLGGVLQQQGRLEEAQQAFERRIETTQTLNDQSQLAIGLNCLGGVLQKQGKLEEAQQAFERGIEIAEALNDQSQLVIGLNCLGVVLQKQGKLEEAQQAFEREIEVAEAFNDQSQLAIGWNCLGGVLQQQGKWEEAQQAFEQRIEIAEALNDQSSLVIGLNCLGGVLQQQGKWEEAQQAFEREIEVAKALNDQSELAIGLSCLGGVLQQQGKWEEAQQVFERGIEIAEALNNQSQLAIGLTRLGGVLQQQGKWEEAQQAFEREIEVAKALNDQSELAIGLSCLGGVLQQQGKWEEAQQVFERGIEIAEALNNQSQLAIGLTRLGGVLQQQGKWEEAQQAFERGIEIAQVLNDQSQLAIGLNCLGGVLQKQGKLEEAQQAFEREIEVAEALNDQSQLVIGLTRLAGVLQKQGKWEEAQQAFEREIEVAEALNDQSQLVIGLNCLGGVLQKQGKLEEAQQAFEREIEVAEALNDQSQLVIGLTRLAGVLQKQGKWEEAQQAFEREIEVAEALNDQSQLVIGLTRLAGVLQKQGKWEEAQQAFEREIEVAEALNDQSLQAWALHNLGRIWKSKREFEHAEKLLKQSQEIFEDENNLPALAKVMNTLGSVLEKQKKWDEAEKILRESYDLAVKLEDKRGQAIIANSLGQVKANQEGEKAFEHSKMYFRHSIKLGEELKARKHLAKVHTAMGKAFLTHEMFELAVDELSKGFEIDESLSNLRGLTIVTNDLTYALYRLGKRKKALAYCNRALKIAPNHRSFRELHDKIQTAILKGIQPTFIKTGIVLFIKKNQKNKFHWGKVRPDDGSLNIIFNEKYIGSKSISEITQGTLVEVEVEEKYEKLYAKQIRVIKEDEEDYSSDDVATIE